jgi:hypothetical protein
MARPEVTGRRAGASASPAKQEDRDDEHLAMTVRQFCDKHNLSNGMYYTNPLIE